MHTPDPPAPGWAGVSIRVAGRNDVGVILRFVRELAEYERLADEVVADERSLERSLFGDRPFAEASIAALDGVDCGFALFFHTFSSFLGRPGLYVEDLYVTPEMRGKGVGGELLRHLARLAVERGCGRLEWSVLDWNTPAIGLYERAGAKPLSEWTMYRLTGDSLAAFAEGRHATR